MHLTRDGQGLKELVSSAEFLEGTTESHVEINAVRWYTWIGDHRVLLVYRELWAPEVDNFGVKTYCWGGVHRGSSPLPS